MFSLYPILTFSALARIPASLNSLIIGSNPIFVTLLSWLLLRERTTGRALLGVALAFLGLATVILGTSELGLQRLDLLGVYISLTGAFTAGTYPILGRVVMRKGDALAATALAHLVGSILLSFLVAQTLGFQPIVAASFPVKAMFTYWGVGAAFAYVIYYWVLKKMEARKAGSFNYLVPIFATILSFLLLGENLGLPFFGGMALTFLGIKLAQE